MTRHALFMVMESVWLCGLLVLLAAMLPASDLPIWFALGFYPAGYTAGRLVLLRAPTMLAEIAAAVGLALLLLAAAGIALLSAEAVAGSFSQIAGREDVLRFAGAGALAGLGWARGWLLAGRQVDIAGFAQGFQFGLGMVLATLFGASRLGVTGDVQAALALGFVTAGLVGLWHARSTAPDAPGGGEATIRNPGPGLLGLAIVLGVGLVFWAALDRTAMDAVVATVIAVVNWLGRMLAALLALLPSPDPGPLELPPPADRAARTPPPQSGLVLNDILQTIFLILFVAPLAILALVMVLKNLLDLVRRLRQSRRTQGLDYGRSGGGFLDGLALLWRHLTGLLRAALARRKARLLAWWRGRADADVAAQYRRLLRRLKSHGWPRRPHETPDEYRRRLAPSWPGSAADLDCMTDAFIAARYGAREGDSRSVAAALGRLRKAIWKLRRTNA